MFIEVTPIGKDNAFDPPVTINFYDVRSFHYDAQFRATILRFFDNERTNLPVVEDIRSIQRALNHLGGFASAKQLAREAARRAEAGDEDDTETIGPFESAS